MNTIDALTLVVLLGGGVIGFFASRRRGHFSLFGGVSAGLILGPVFAWVLFLNPDRSPKEGAVFLCLSFLLGALLAFADGHPFDREWLSAAIAPLLIGTVIASAGKIFARTSIPRGAFWASIIFLWLSAFHHISA